MKSCKEINVGWMSTKEGKEKKVAGLISLANKN